MMSRIGLDSHLQSGVQSFADEERLGADTKTLRVEQGKQAER
jgi:hypothetical protein